MIIWGFHMTNKTSPDPSGRTKNEHIKYLYPHDQ